MSIRVQHCPIMFTSRKEQSVNSASKYKTYVVQSVNKDTTNIKQKTNDKSLKMIYHSDDIMFNIHINYMQMKNNIHNIFVEI